MKKNTTIILTAIIVLLGTLFLFLSLGYFNNENLPQGIQDLFPRGEDTPFPEGSDNENTEEPDTQGNGEEIVSSSSRFTQIFSGEVSGYTVINTNNNEVVRFMEKESGHIYDYNKKTSVLAKISNQTMPGVSEVLWSDDGNTLIARRFDEKEKIIKNILISFNKTSSSNDFYTFTKERKEGETGNDILFLQKTLNASSVTRISNSGVGSPGKETTYFGSRTKDALKKFQEQEGISKTGMLDKDTIIKLNEVNTFLFGTQKEDEDITETPLLTRDLGSMDTVAKGEGSTIFYTKQTIGGVEGYTSTIDLKTPLRVFKNPASLWIASFPNKNTIALQTKSSGGLHSYIYFLNQKTGELSDALGGVYGLTTKISPSGNLILYSATNSQRKDLSTFVFDRTTKQRSDLQIKTLADKCTWANETSSFVFCAVPESLGEGTLPDSWYQGKEKFNDMFWMIDTSKNRGTLLFENERRALRSKIDAQNLTLGKDDDVLYMINKLDTSLWSLRLNE